MKYLIITLFSVILMGCKANTEETTGLYSLPEGLKDCQIYRVEGERASTIRVIRCPNSTTSTTHSCGKSCTTSNTLIED